MYGIEAKKESKQYSMWAVGELTAEKEEEEEEESCQLDSLYAIYDFC